jgi:hypothetical protein
MANYTKTTNFTAKDGYSSGDSRKIVRGSEHDTEYNNIATAVQTKADLASPALTGTATAVNLTVSGTLLAGSDTVTSNTATQTLTNKTLTSPTINGGSISGITDLAVADGGTGVSTLAANAVLVGNGTSAVQTVAPGTSGNLLTSNGTAWVSSAAPAGGVTSVAATAGTGIAVTGSPITSSGTLNITNTGVTSVTAGTGISISASTGGITITNSAPNVGSGTVTSVATGNGLSGGTITTTGTLVLACPTENSVGSYAIVYMYFSPGQSVAFGSNYAAGSGFNQVSLTLISSTNRSSSTGSISGTWKWLSLGGAFNTCYGDATGLACRVA